MIVIFQFSLMSNAGESDSAEFLQNLSDVPCAKSYNPYVTPPYCGGYCPLDYVCSLNKTASGCVCIYTGHVCKDDSECPNCESCIDSKCIKGGECVTDSQCAKGHTCKAQQGNDHICDCFRPPTLEEKCAESCGGGPSFVFVTGGLPSSQCIGTASELERINASLIRACCCGTSPLYGGKE